ncbi:hypothetical protein JTB14_033287 [Gonioctena quinquepunctata]|nr:hypothetical protein JTB14_033287 [Gonioctena quinquepunctata]
MQSNFLYLFGSDGLEHANKIRTGSDFAFVSHLGKLLSLVGTPTTYKNRTSGVDTHLFDGQLKKWFGWDFCDHFSCLDTVVYLVRIVRLCVFLILRRIQDCLSVI